MKLHDQLKDVFPGAGDYAAVKVHKTLSVGCGSVVAYHFSPARDHDSPHLVLDESWRGLAFWSTWVTPASSGSATASATGISIVIRLKGNGKPKVTRVARADLKKTFVPGTDLGAW